MSGLSLETCRSNFKSVAFTILELLAFNAQKIKGSVYATLATPLFEKLRGRVRTPWERALHVKLKSVALTILNWSD